MAQVLLVDGAQHVSVNGVEVVEAVASGHFVQALDDYLEGSGLALQLLAEVGGEEKRVVGGVELAKQLIELRNKISLAVLFVPLAQQRAQERGLDLAVLAGADEDQSVEDALHGLINLLDGPLRVVRSQIAEELTSPLGQVSEELAVHRCFLHLPAHSLSRPVERSLLHGGTRQQPQIVKTIQVLVPIEVLEDGAGGMGLLPLGVEDLDPFEVAEDGPGDAFEPGVVDGLPRPAGIFQVFGNFLGLQEKARDAAQAEGKVHEAPRYPFLRADLASVLDVPAQGTEKGQNELLPGGGFIVPLAVAGGQPGETLHQPFELGFGISVGYGHF